jgi:hypothetical protein
MLKHLDAAIKSREAESALVNPQIGEGGKMLLTIRVTIAIFLGGIALWSQTLDENHNVATPAVAEAELLRDPSPAPRVPQGQFTLKMNPPQFSPELGNLGLASYPALSFDPQATGSQAPPSPPKAFSYDNGHYTRQKIHKYASLATLPLFVAEGIVGEKLMNETNTNNSLRGAHSALTAGMGVLFGAESIFGIWNMWDARKDPNGHSKRMIHGILMLAADAGFVATAVSAPKHQTNAQGVRTIGDASTHRNIAFASMGIATVGYLYMLVVK